METNKVVEPKLGVKVVYFILVLLMSYLGLYGMQFLALRLIPSEIFLNNPNLILLIISLTYFCFITLSVLYLKVYRKAKLKIQIRRILIFFISLFLILFARNIIHTFFPIFLHNARHTGLITRLFFLINSSILAAISYNLIFFEILFYQFNNKKRKYLGLLLSSFALVIMKISPFGFYSMEDYVYICEFLFLSVLISVFYLKFGLLCSIIAYSLFDLQIRAEYWFDIGINKVFINFPTGFRILMIIVAVILFIYVTLFYTKNKY